MRLSPDRFGMSHAERLAGFGAVSTSLALMSDRRLGQVVDEARLDGSGIGGTAGLLEIEGTPVFLKRVPLTDLERRPDNVMSTANLFDLPTYYQYGVGSAGFGVWRELAAHAMTTNWVLERQCESFPLMYHWRVLPGPPPRAPASEERAALSAMVAYWNGSSAVRRRLEARARSSANVALFLEYIPQNLGAWLTAQVGRGDDVLESACAMVERSLRSDVVFMNSNGLLHFDAHFDNILTDGRRLFFSDFGLAMSRRFELSAAESTFFGGNLSYDRCHTVTLLVDWLVRAVADSVDRDDFIRRCAESAEPVDVPKPVAAIIKRYAPVAVVMNEFYRKLQRESRTTPYPGEELAWAGAAIGLPPVS